MEVKTEDEPVAAAEAQQDSRGREQQQEAAAEAQAEVKSEDKGGHHGRKRPYEENRSYGYYEHREEKR